jgi:hypothetical protein
MDFTTASPVDIMQKLMDRGYGPQQTRLAAFMGVTQSTIAGWSVGKPMTRMARRLAEELAKRKAPRQKPGGHTQRTGEQGKP